MNNVKSRLKFHQFFLNSCFEARVDFSQLHMPRPLHVSGYTFYETKVGFNLMNFRVGGAIARCGPSSEWHLALTMSHRQRVPCPAIVPAP